MGLRTFCSVISVGVFILLFGKAYAQDIEYHVTVEFKQHVSLVRTHDIRLFGATWSTEHKG